jgi:hypothetical protein
MDYKKDIPYLHKGTLIFFLGYDIDGDSWWKFNKEDMVIKGGNDLGVFRDIDYFRKQYTYIKKLYEVPFTYEDIKHDTEDCFGTDEDDFNIQTAVIKTKLALKLIGNNIEMETERYIWIKK